MMSRRSFTSAAVVTPIAAFPASASPEKSSLAERFSGDRLGGRDDDALVADYRAWKQLTAEADAMYDSDLSDDEREQRCSALFDKYDAAARRIIAAPAFTWLGMTIKLRLLASYIEVDLTAADAPYAANRLLHGLLDDFGRLGASHPGLSSKSDD